MNEWTDPKTLIERLQLYRAAARTERCHNVPPIHRQTVGEHTFGMLALLRLIYPCAPLELVWAVLDHDVPEGVTGDIPSPMLARYAQLKNGDAQAARDTQDAYLLSRPDQLRPDHFKIYKFCDRMELAIFALEEADTGNSKMLTLYYTCMRSIEKDRLTDVTPEALQVYDYVKTYAERYYGDQHERMQQMLHGTPNR